MRKFMIFKFYEKSISQFLNNIQKYIKNEYENSRKNGRFKNLRESTIL